MQAYTYTHTADFPLESGEVLKGFTLQYCTFGKQRPDNVVWVCHALTGNADVSDWWAGLFGEGCLFNPEEHFAVCANVLGSCYGSTGPLSDNPATGSPYYDAFPLVTIRDMVRALDCLRQHLGIGQVQVLVGGSLGGQQALEWAAMRPELFGRMVVAATNAFHSPWGVAFNEAQRLAIQADPTWGQPHAQAGQQGLKAARAVAMLSYRNYETYAGAQSDPDEEKIDDFRASSYQRYQGDKLVRRFNAYSYWALSKAMDSHNLGRGRGSAAEVLMGIRARTLVVGISSDVLFPPAEQRFIARHLPGAQYREIPSVYGHDGFLVETAQLAEAIGEFLGK